MSAPHPAMNGLFGSTDWSLPEDWRMVSTKSDAAADLVAFCQNDPDRVTRLSVTDLGDVISAVALIRAIPPQLRTAKVGEIAVRQRSNELKSTSYRPKVSKLGVASLIVNPVGTLAGTAIGIAAKTAGRHLVARHLFDENDWLEWALDTVEMVAVDNQLHQIFSDPLSFPRSPEFDTEMGRRVYWLAFESRRCEIGTIRTLSSLPSDFEFTPGVATTSMASSAERLESRRNSTALLSASPYDPGLTEIDTIERKLKRGKNVPEMNAAWQWAFEADQLRQRFVVPYAQRMGWAIS